LPYLPTNLDESGRFCDAQLAAGRANKPMASPLAFGTAVGATSLNRDAPMTRMPNRPFREKDRDFDLPQQRFLRFIPDFLGSVWNHFKRRFFLLHPAVVLITSWASHHRRARRFHDCLFL
jgi:hypothetical protein